jgi:selenocysteine-specific elongation factor
VTSSPSSAAPPLVLGTAGHIDHGKTALISVLTGKNTDRLEEERRRGISIELGYAPLRLSSGRRLSVVDVPGHERFVRTMVAGASGVDMFLLCVAADDGVMPQTREHLAVLRGLGVEHGVVAITKCDIGDPPAIDLGFPAVPVSAKTGEGLEELRATLDEVAARLPGRADAPGFARLHVDRSFTLRGIGTVVTGTLWSGVIAAGDAVTVLPRGLEARVRSVQVHDEPVDQAAAGQRVALNLNGVGWREVARGDVIVPAGADLQPTYRINVAMNLEPGRYQLHHGTRDAPARAVQRDGYTQFRLEQPFMALEGDRVVIRQIAPPDTLGGGVIKDAHPSRSEVRHPSPVTPSPATRDPRPLDDTALRIAAELRADGRAPRTDNEIEGATKEHWRALERAGLAVRVGPNLHFHPEPLAELEERVIELMRRDGQATIASVRDELQTSRKYAQALLEHLDAKRVAVRRGDAHFLRQR